MSLQKQSLGDEYKDLRNLSGLPFMFGLMLVFDPPSWYLPSLVRCELWVGQWLWLRLGRATGDTNIDQGASAPAPSGCCGCTVCTWSRGDTLMVHHPPTHPHPRHTQDDLTSDLSTHPSTPSNNQGLENKARIPPAWKLRQVKCYCCKSPCIAAFLSTPLVCVRCDDMTRGS